MLDTSAILVTLRACRPACEWATSFPSLADAWAACSRGDWMLWLAAKLEIPRPLLVLAACACAREALVHVSAGEDRPLRAIETAEAWARGGDGAPSLADVRTAADAAYAAAAAAAADAAAASAAYAAADAAYAAAAADAAADAAYAAAAAAADAAYAAAYAAYAAADAAYAAADAAYAAADAAYAAAAADAAARPAALARSADIVRAMIPWEAIETAANGRTFARRFS